MNGTIHLLPLYAFTAWTRKNHLLPFNNVERQEGAHRMFSELTWNVKLQAHYVLYATQKSVAH
jgi:ABC-type molybdenum transport system ATPase subunit/photorepair protein PhrA